MIQMMAAATTAGRDQVRRRAFLVSISGISTAANPTHHVLKSSSEAACSGIRPNGRLSAFTLAPVAIESGHALRLISSEASAGNGEINPFKTQYTAEDADKADRVIRSLIKSKLASGTPNNERAFQRNFLGGVLNSYRLLVEKAADKANQQGKRRPDATYAKKADELLRFVEDACAHHPLLSPAGIKSYSMVIDAYAKIGDPASAEAVLLRMKPLYRAGNERLQPDAVTFNSIIDAWAKSGIKGAAIRAEALLKEMEDLSENGSLDCLPDTTTYSAVIDAWAKSGEKGGGKRAEAILNHMMKLSKDGRDGCRPDTAIFSAVIDAWARSKDRDAYKHAQRVFHQMVALQGKGNSDIDPNVITYTSLINALAVSSTPDKAIKARSILGHMEEMAKNGKPNVSPNTMTYNAVLKACARSPGSPDARTKALKVGLGVFGSLKRSPDMGPDSFTYDTLFFVIKNAVKGQEYAKVAERAFQLCCEDGVLDDVILRNLRRHAPSDMLRKLFGSSADGLSVKDLPSEWSRNILRR